LFYFNFETNNKKFFKSLIKIERENVYLIFQANKWFFN
jgi:hypothetical protein